ncbi:PREDICTED: uncharacterized protein LOC106102811 [Papilio polytes]|uniref:uncharacterized protein LOC106102811 n=1 Tax=Papilio polytes TaxID=76194 RepID=UPI000676358C|nr:PREDICTED: uncharacterized protein LOC106102811 [Papilio polytes]
MSCGRGAVPSLACAACLCLYHPACAGLPHSQIPPSNFLCKNCRKSTSPPLEPPPLTHKSGATVPAGGPEGVSGGVTGRRPSGVPSPLPVPAKVRPDKRVLLRMKVAGGKEDGTRVWAVAPTSSGP